jgi:hypothetical protein
MSSTYVNLVSKGTKDHVLDRDLPLLLYGISLQGQVRLSIREGGSHSGDLATKLGLISAKVYV